LESAKQLAGPGGCYAFYYDTAARKLTISLHLLQDTPTTAEMAVATLAHAYSEGREEEEDAALLGSSAAENALDAAPGEWGLYRSQTLNKVRRVRAPLKALQPRSSPIYIYIYICIYSCDESARR